MVAFYFPLNNTSGLVLPPPYKGAWAEVWEDWDLAKIPCWLHCVRIYGVKPSTLVPNLKVCLRASFGPLALSGWLVGETTDNLTSVSFHSSPGHNSSWPCSCPCASTQWANGIGSTPRLETFGSCLWGNSRSKPLGTVRWKRTDGRRVKTRSGGWVGGGRIEGRRERKGRQARLCLPRKHLSRS